MNNSVRSYIPTRHLYLTSLDVVVEIEGGELYIYVGYAYVAICNILYSMVQSPSAFSASSRIFMEQETLS